MNSPKVARIRSWNSLQKAITQCGSCPRLREHCERIAAEKRAAYRDQTYWGKPVPNLGDGAAQVLIVGLAPAAHGANRTGRMFTGDRSGDWLFRALFKAGFANQSEATHREDGLQLTNCAITAVCHCAPPDNKPTREEIDNCRPFLTKTIQLSRVSVFVALGSLAWNATVDFLRETGQLQVSRRPSFTHLAEVEAENAFLVGSYHPSQQNTFTGRLTEEMLDQVFIRAKELLAQSSRSQ